MPEAGDRAEEEAARLVALCREAGRPGWLTALQEGRAELAGVAGGRLLQFRLRMTGQAAADVAILSDGLVARFPQGTAPVDGIVEGEPITAANFLLGRGSLEDAITAGVFVPSSGVDLDLIDRVRKVVAVHLRRLVAGPAAVFALSRRLGWRLQRARLSMIGPGVVEGIAPLVVAAAVILGVGSVQGHAPAAVLDAATIVATTRDEADVESANATVDAEPSGWSTAVGSANSAPSTPARSQLEQPSAGRAGEQRAAFGATIGTPATTEGLGVGSNDFQSEREAHCNTITGGALCVVVRAVPPPPTVP